MRKTDKETIIAGAVLLKEYCNNHINCTSCAFKEVRHEVGCMFDHIPANYDIKALEEKLNYASAKLHLSSVYGKTCSTCYPEVLGVKINQKGEYEKVCYADTDSILKGEENGNRNENKSYIE